MMTNVIWAANGLKVEHVLQLLLQELNNQKIYEILNFKFHIFTISNEKKNYKKLIIFFWRLWDFQIVNLLQIQIICWFVWGCL